MTLVVLLMEEEDALASWELSEASVSKPSPLLGINLHESSSVQRVLLFHSLKCHLQIMGMAGQKKITPV